MVGKPGAICAMLIAALFMAQILALLAPISHPVSEMPKILCAMRTRF